jgi:hypothetical protein
LLPGIVSNFRFVKSLQIFLFISRRLAHGLDNVGVDTKWIWLSVKGGLHDFFGVKLVIL